MRRFLVRILILLALLAMALLRPRPTSRARPHPQDRSRAKRSSLRPTVCAPTWSTNMCPRGPCRPSPT